MRGWSWDAYRLAVCQKVGTRPDHLSIAHSWDLSDGKCLVFASEIEALDVLSQVSRPPRLARRRPSWFVPTLRGCAFFRSPPESRARCYCRLCRKPSISGRSLVPLAPDLSRGSPPVQ